MYRLDAINDDSPEISGESWETGRAESAGREQERGRR